MGRWLLLSAYRAPDRCDRRPPDSHLDRMPKIPRIERLLNLVSLLFHARAPVPWAVIKEQVIGYDDGASDETLERRFERDKNELRDLGIPVEYTLGDEFSNEGYIVHKADCFLPTLDLSPEDATLLSLIGRVAAPGLPAGLADHLSSAVTKLSFFANDGPDLVSSAEEQFLLATQGPRTPSAQPEHLDSVVEALVQRQTMQFTYYAISHDRTRTRTVDPYGVGFHAGNWYLVGRDHERDDVRSFRLDRVRSTPKTADDHRDGPSFDVPEDFRLSDHVGRHSWELPEPASGPVEVRVRLDPTVAWMVRDDPPRDGRLELFEDGSGMLTVATERPDALVRWVLRLTAHAEVIEPDWLRQRCADAARRVADLYAEERHAQRP